MNSDTDVEIKSQPVTQVMPHAREFFSLSHRYFFGQEYLRFARKRWEEARCAERLPFSLTRTVSEVHQCRLAKRSMVTRTSRHSQPRAVVSGEEYFVLSLRCAAEATSTTPSVTSMILLVISQYKRDNVRLRQRHRFVRISSRLLRHHWPDGYKINHG